MEHIHCKHVQENLFNYLSNELTREQKEVIDDHVSTCIACSKLLDDFRVIESIISQDKAISPSPYIGTRIIQRLENEAIRGTIKRIPILRPASMAAGILLAILIGYGIGQLSIYQSSGQENSYNSVESLKTDLFIHDFIDENITDIINE